MKPQQVKGRTTKSKWPIPAGATKPPPKTTMGGTKQK